MNHKPTLTDFPKDNWVKITIGSNRYVGRALLNERAQIVATVDAAGKSVTFSWPYICANATSIDILPFVDEALDA